MLDERRLARPVLAHQPEHDPAGDLQAHPVERDRAAEPPRQAVDCHHRPARAGAHDASPPACAMAWSLRWTRSTTSSTATPSCRASASKASTRPVRILSRSRCRQRRSGVGDERPRRPAFLHQARRLQLPVGAPPCSGSPSTAPPRPDRRQLLARRQPARRHQVLHLVDDLQVDRHPVARRNVNLHGPTFPRRRTMRPFRVVLIQ